MRGKTIFKLNGETILHFPELYDPINMPDSIVVEGQPLLIDHISDEICSEIAKNSAKGFWLCRTIHFKHST